MIIIIIIIMEMCQRLFSLIITSRVTFPACCTLIQEILCETIHHSCVSSCSVHHDTSSSPES